MGLIQKVFLFLFCATSIFASSNNLKKVSLQLNWKYQFEYAGFIVAKEKGYYKEQGLDLEIREFKEDINILEEIKTKRATFGIYDLSLSYFNDNKNSLKLIANYFKRSALVFVANQDILTPEDFKNKIIMAEKGQLEHSTLSTLLKKFNIKQNDYNFIPHDFSAKKFIDGEVDIMSAYLSNELYEIRKAKKTHTIVDPIYYDINGSGVNVFTSEENTIKNPNLIKKFIEASNKGWLYALENKEEIVDLIYNKYSKLKSKKALLFEANQTEKLVLSDIYDIGSINESLLEKQINTFSKNGLLDKKIHIENFIFDYKKNKNRDNFFSNEEKNYILNKNQITMCIDPNWMPYEKIDNSKHIGITSEYISIFQEKIGIPIKLIKTENWEESLNNAKNRKCDILSLAMPSPSRNKFLNFTEPYISFPLVIATKTDKLFVTNPEEIINTQKIGLVKAYAMTEILKNKYPKNKIVEVANVDEGLKLVEEEKIYGFIDALPTIAYALQHEYLNELKIAGKFNENLELSVAIRNDDLILLDIFQKVVNEIEESEKQGILNKYISVNIGEKFDYEHFFQILFVIGLFVLFGIYRERQLVKYNKTLTKQRNELELVQAKLKSSLQNVQTLLDATIEAVFVFENQICIDANDGAIKMFGYKNKEEILGLHLSAFVTNNSYQMIVAKTKSGENSTYELRAVKKSGKKFPIIAKGTNAILDSKHVRISGVIDISEMKEKEKILFQQSKMASMGEMLENIAHQWRQPLSLISSTATSLELKTELDISTKDESINNLRKINTTTQYLSQTIEDFRNFFKQDKEKNSFYILNNIKRNLNLLEKTLNNNNIQIVFELEEDTKIRSYENEFTQAILNVFTNAIDALLNKENDRFIFVKCKRFEQSFEISIKDNAGGIKENILESIFEPYFTTKHKAQGTGIGLYMTHQIIEKNMNGSVGVKNKEFTYCNKKYLGAEFTIILPL